MAAQQRLPTCQEAYNRIRWDASLDAAAYTIGYATRSGSIKEKALLSWDPEGDIPWHRVRFIRCGDQIMWDREARIDRIVHPEPAAPATPSAAPTPASSQRPAWRWDGQRWTPGSLPAPPAPLTLHVITQNVLFDTFDADKLDTPARTAALLSMLDAADADLVALQEVTPALLATLLAQPWVRARYNVSEGPDAASVTPHGQLLLARHPMTCALHPFSPRKNLLLATLSPANTPPIALAVAHLTSSRAPDGPAKRAAQLDTTLALTRAAPHLLLLGDLNMRDGELTQPLTQHAMTDLWPALVPDQPGLTYDPHHNPLAAALSTSQEPSRYDRIFLRSEHQLLRADSIQLIGAPDQPLISDHWGLSARLSLIPARAGRPTVTTALAVLLPLAHAAPIQAIRAQHDPSFVRWPPHINLIYPFVPVEDFDAAHALITAALADQAPFSITLAGLDQFEHRASRSIWIKPASAGHLEALRAALIALFPQCDEREARGDAPFSPHLTIAKLSAEQPWRNLIQQWQAELEPIRFQLPRLVMLARSEDQPFQAVRAIPLGPAPSIAAALAACPDAQPAPTPLDAIALLRRLAGDTAHVHIFGSQLLDVATRASDLDVVIASTDDHDAALKALAQRLEREPLASHVTLAAEATVPVLRARVAGASVDVLHARIPDHTPPARADLARQDALDEPSRRALDGVLGGDLLLERLCELEALDAAQVALRWVKVWARRRQISGTAWGFWGGFSWATLVTRAAQDLRRAGHLPDAEAIAARALGLLATWSWPAPLTLDAPPPTTQRSRADHMPLLHPLPPHANTSRSMTGATAAILKAEALAAWRDGAPDWSLDAATPDLRAPHIALTMDPDQRGWLERRAVALLLQIEAAGCRAIRPYPAGALTPDGLHIPITLDHAELARPALTALEAEAAREGVALSAVISTAK
jgi:poly(A) polymerase